MSASCNTHGHSHDHHDHGEAGNDPVYRRILVVALLVNLAMFVVEIVTSRAAMSDALLADSIDFLGDAANYAVSLWVLGAALAIRARASLLKAASMAIFGLWVLGSTTMNVLAGNVPVAPTMGIVGALALAANFGVALLLYRFRNGDSNMQSVWLCTRNDAVGNVAVLVAALGVFATGQGWPDALVAAGMGVLALHSAVRVTRQAMSELRPAAA
jgi:Co/Zn/Cd efflux system component